jgi:hypothetical protein
VRTAEGNSAVGVKGFATENVAKLLERRNKKSVSREKSTYESRLVTQRGKMNFELMTDDDDIYAGDAQCLLYTEFLLYDRHCEMWTDCEKGCGYVCECHGSRKC